jgi:uncharacterized Ntn-hydrolase superfamily protein
MALGSNDFFLQTFTTTLQKYEKQLVDNVLQERPFLEMVKSEAKSQTGRGLVIPLRAANLGATGYTDASGTHSAAVSSDIMGSAVFDFADGIITPFRVKHRDILQNSGPEQIVNLVEEYVKGATADHGDFIVSELHKDAASWTPGELIPLDVLFGDAVSDAAVASANPGWGGVGGINPNDANKSYWQSVRLTSDPATEDIVASFRRITNEIYRTSRKRVDHVLAGFDVYEELEAYLQDKGYYKMNDGGDAQTRFTEVKFGSLTVRLDPDMADTRAYFINKGSLRFAYSSGEFMKTYPAQPVADTTTATLDSVVPISSVIQVGVAERRCNGVLDRVGSGS